MRRTRMIHRALGWACSAALAGPAWAGEAPATRPGSLAAGGPALLAAAVIPAAPPMTAGEANDKKEVLIVQALAQPTSLQIEDAPIGEAIGILSKDTGVPIRFDPFILGCLPYGSETRLTATIENRPLSESLTELLRPLAAEYVLDGDKLLIRPRPALFRICRRATWDEVGLIEKLYNSPWSRKLADSLQFQFQDMPSTDAEANRKKICQLAESVGAGSAGDVLEHACRQYGWEWFPTDKTISVCTSARQIERQLDRTVTVQYNEVQLKDVLLDLAGRAGVELRMEPGVLGSLPTHQSERFRMAVENVTVRQALELIAGETGLGYFIEPGGIRITASTLETKPSPSQNSPEAAERALAAIRANPIVGQITMPGENGSTISFFLREQDLSPEVNQLRLRYIRDASEKLRANLSTQVSD